MTKSNKIYPKLKLITKIAVYHQSIPNISNTDTIQIS